MRTVLKICVVCFGLYLRLLEPLEAAQAVAPFTSGEGSATVETCTPKALGAHPHPALLAACLYVLFSADSRTWEMHDQPNYLLSRYATVAFNDLLEKNYQWSRQTGEGLRAFEIFFSDERFDEFAVSGSTFDLSKGLVIVKTLNDGKPSSYRVLFVIENGLWRVDDIHLFHHRCHMVKPIKAVLANLADWYRQSSNCRKR